MQSHFPLGNLAAADELATRLDRSRIWVVAEAIRRYVASKTETQNPGLRPSRSLQLARDLALTAEQRVFEAEETLRLSELISPSRPTGPRTFNSYDEFLDWKQHRDLHR